MFFGAVLGPILLITIFSIAMIITVLFVLIRQVLRNHRQKTYSISKANPPPAGQTCKQILLLVCIMVLLGFSVTSFLLTTVWSGTSIDVAFGFRLAFLFCNSFQGFFIFVLLVFFNSEARNSWLKVLCPCCTRRDGISKSSSSDTAAQKTLKPGQFSRFSAASLNKSMTDQVERLKPDHEMKVINEAANLDYVDVDEDNIYEDLDEYEDLIEVDNKQNSNSVIQVEENATRQQEKMIKSAKQTKLQAAHYKAYSRFENNDDDDDYD